MLHSPIAVGVVSYSRKSIVGISLMCSADLVNDYNLIFRHILVRGTTEEVLGADEWVSDKVWGAHHRDERVGFHIWGAGLSDHAVVYLRDVSFKISGLHRLLMIP